MQLAAAVFYKAIHCVKYWHQGEVQRMFEEEVEEDETFTPGWGMRIGSTGVPSCPGEAQHCWHKPKRQHLCGTDFLQRH